MTFEDFLTQQHRRFLEEQFSNPSSSFHDLSDNGVHAVNAIFNLDVEVGDEQDWDLIHSDASRLLEFLNAFETKSLSAETKLALAALVVASYDSYLRNVEDSNDFVWNQFQAVLRQDLELYLPLLNYWANWLDPHIDAGWAVTRRIRRFVYSSTLGN